MALPKNQYSLKEIEQIERKAQIQILEKLKLRLGLPQNIDELSGIIIDRMILELKKIDNQIGKDQNERS